MKTICNLNYTTNIKKLIQTTIKQAQNNIFDTYYLIVDDPLFFEEACFNYIDTLFNIQIITYKQLITKLLSTYHINIQEYSKLDKILIIKLLIESNDNLFNTPNKIDLISELLDIYDLFYLEELDKNVLNNIPAMSKTKMETIIELYFQIKESNLNDKVFKVADLLLEQLDDQIANNHYYFITEKVLTKHHYHFVKQLSKYSDVIVLLTCNNDARDLNQPYLSYLTSETINDNHDSGYLNHLNQYTFSLQAPKYPGNNPLYTIIQTTPKAEIESVVLNIYRDLVDNQGHYHDYAIYYPNQEYQTLLLETLANFNIPHNLTQNRVFKELEACLLLLKYQLNHQNDDLIDLIDTKVLKKYSDYNFVDKIKKIYIETKRIPDSFNNYCFDNCRSLTDFSKVMIDFINQEMITNENSLLLINFFKDLTSDQSFTLNDFNLLVNQLKPQLKEDKTLYQDHIYLLNYHQPYSGIINCKQIYLTGVNETVVPEQFKDTGILLDHDYQCLKLPDLNFKIAVNQNNILKVLNSNDNFVVISFANGTIDGQPLLKSSLYTQLKQLFDIKNLDISKDYLHASLLKNLYLKGGQTTQKEAINQMIAYYKQNKNQPVTLSVPLFSNYLSASKLETYNGCPYKYYHQYGLKIYPFKQVIFQTNEIGSIVHYVLEQSKDLFSQKELDLNNLKTMIHQTINQYLSDNQLLDRLTNYNNHYIIRMISQDLINTIIVLNQQLQASDFNIIESELEINRQYPDFKFTGIVDRVDQYENYLKIIDYKSSNKDLDISLAIQGFNIQMLLYLDTLASKYQLDLGALLYFNTKRRILSSTKKINEAELSENYFKQYRMNGYVNEKIVTNIDNDFDTSSNIIKARYVKKDDSYKGNILSSFALKRLIDYVTGHIETLYQQLESGNIAIAPKGSNDPAIFTKVNPCTYCNYRAICNFDVFYNEYTLVNDENLEYLIKEGEENAG